MRVAVAIPSYLGAGIIERTLRSVLRQTYQDWTCVVVNDGEDDGTRAVVDSLGDPRFRYVNDGIRRGQFGNFNRAILESLCADPQVVRLLCSDDVLYPHDLDDIVRLFRAHPSVGLVATHYDGIDENDSLIFRVEMDGRPDLVMTGRDYLLKGVAVGNTIGGPSSVAIRRAALDTAGVFDTRVNHSGEADLWHRVAAAWDIAWVGHRAGYQYRFHNQSITGRGKYSTSKFTDQIQVVRRVASTEAIFGPRWWVHQYTIGRLHSINVQLILAMAAKGRWDGVKAGLTGSWREGLLFYSPFWLPRLPIQLVRLALGQNASRRILFRRIHEWLQPRRVRIKPDDGQAPR
ncbi:MAG TPA: glycosyltransferase [Gemmatimonadaceae bacterium]|nr:glycosyltransferase [Gemmatimonadaceae bacterium]